MFPQTRGRTKKKLVGEATPRRRKRRDFDALYYMGSTTAVGDPPVSPVIRALPQTMVLWFCSLEKHVAAMSFCTIIQQYYLS